MNGFEVCEFRGDSLLQALLRAYGFEIFGLFKGFFLDFLESHLPIFIYFYFILFIFSV